METQTNSEGNYSQDKNKSARILENPVFCNFWSSSFRSKSKRRMDWTLKALIVSISLISVICTSEGASISSKKSEVKVPTQSEIPNIELSQDRPEVSSPLHVAQCRATCLQKFNNQLLDSSCFTHSDCHMCWKSCELLESFAQWKSKSEDDKVGSSKKNKSLGTMCSQSSRFCTLGCQVACGFYENLMRNNGPVSVVATKRANVLHISSGKIEWPQEKLEMKLAEIPNIVYVLIQQYSDLKWRQITQTTETSVEISNTLSTQMANKLRNVRLLVVSPNGLVSIFYPQQKQDENVDKIYNIVEATTKNTPIISSPTEELDLNSRILKVDYSIPSTTNEPKEETQSQNQPEIDQESWNLKKVSLIHQKSLVIAELAWNPVKYSEDQEYLITWELDGGGLKGHLVTDSTSVSLSLWPDTLYHIQVELFEKEEGEEDGEGNEESEPKSKSYTVTVDTSEASFPLLEKPSALSESHKSLLDFLNVNLLLTISSAAIFVLGCLLVAISCHNVILQRRRCSNRDSQLLQDTDDLEDSEKHSSTYCESSGSSVAIISPAQLIYPSEKAHLQKPELHSIHPALWWQGLSTREPNNHYHINNSSSTKMYLPPSSTSNPNNSLTFS